MYDLELSVIYASACQVLGLQVFVTMPNFIFVYLIVFTENLCNYRKGWSHLAWLSTSFSKYQLANIEIPLVLTCKSSTVYYLAASKLNS